jgi:NTE family protein
LCLSGGGFRATLFHLGALQRLNELGVLSRADFRTVSSVSGGSITAAHIASVIRWPLRDRVPDWAESVARPLRRFTSQDIRTGPVLDRLLLPWNWLRESTAVESLARRYAKLTPLMLASLPQQPDVVLCATDMSFGVNWEFRRDRLGDYLAGRVDTPPDWPLARAVAASSCFPPVFNPLPMRFPPERYSGGKAAQDDKKAWRAALEDLRLTDGGIYDNMGLEPVWKNHLSVLVSDAGGLFDFESDRNFIWRIERYDAIQENQSRALRKRWLISSFVEGVMQGTYWGTGSARSSFFPQDQSGYSKALARDIIATIRTDLDAFSDAEAAVLQNHGYLLADAALKKHVPDLYGPAAPPLTPPSPDWLPPEKTEAEIRKALRNSHKRKLLGRKRP